MSPRRVMHDLVRQAPTLGPETSVAEAVRTILDDDLPALPVVDGEGELCGIFGEREFMAALFPGYVEQLGYAGFVPKRLDEALHKRAGCRDEPISQHMTTEHVEVGEDFSDVEVAETFLHHRVLILPVTDRDRRVVGVIPRSEFFAQLATRFLEAG